MRALCVERPGVARVVERPRPEPGPGEVLLAIDCVGLCGTDLSTFAGKNPLVTYPRVIGHELAGRVVARGDGVGAEWDDLAVAVSPYKACGSCAACRLRRPNACRNNQTLGVQREGGLAEFAAVPVERLHASRRLTSEQLALVEPFSIGMHAVNRARVTPDDTVVVIGCGGVGAGAIAAASERGAYVIGLDLDARKLALARAFGAREGVDATRSDAGDQIRALTGGEGPSVVIEAVGSVATYRQALDIVAACGRIACLGWLKGDVPLEGRQIVAKEVEILGSRNAMGEFPAVIAMFESGRVDPRRLVTHRVPLAEAPPMFEAWMADPAGTGKVLVTLQGR